MALFDWFDRAVRKQAAHLTYAVIPSGQTDNPVDNIQPQADRHYVRVWLAEMFLRDDRRLFRSFTPVVHSAVTLKFGAKAAQELPYVAGPANLGIQEKLEAGIQLNHALTNLLPFRGGTLQVSAGLVAYQRKDFLTGFVDVLSDVSGIFNVGQLSAVLKVAEGAVDGIQNLLGAQDKDLHLLYVETFGGNANDSAAPLSSGYRAIVRANPEQIKPERLFVKRSQLHIGDDLESSKPLTGYDYMLLRFEVANHRDDALSFEAFDKPLNEAIRLGYNPETRAEGEALMRSAAVQVWTSDDLTHYDKRHVALELKRRYEVAIGGEPAEAQSLSVRAQSSPQPGAFAVPHASLEPDEDPLPDRPSGFLKSLGWGE